MLMVMMEVVVMVAGGGDEVLGLLGERCRIVGDDRSEGSEW